MNRQQKSHQLALDLLQLETPHLTLSHCHEVMLMAMSLFQI